MSWGVIFGPSDDAEELSDIEEGGVPCVLGFVEWQSSPLSCSGYWSEQLDIDSTLHASVDRVIVKRGIKQILLE